ncbi:hypothetical protein NDN08_004017 [Rhodosorus marinus]|uniref:Uncharacterized protein n=1 Tax=Rhodosorus marinus TaxID=101924 RepID=A0AAV8UKM0_9RHOD|nr:hypothetical protein NDN08_004017 [Rhodosorus marinus]
MVRGEFSLRASWESIPCLLLGCKITPLQAPGQACSIPLGCWKPVERASVVMRLKSEFGSDVEIWNAEEGNVLLAFEPLTTSGHVRSFTRGETFNFRHRFLESEPEVEIAALIMRFCSLGDLGGQGSSEISMACIVRKSSESNIVPIRNGKSFLLDYKVMNSPGDYSGLEQSTCKSYTRELVKHVCVDSVYVETASSLYFKITTCLCHVVKLSWKAILKGQGIEAFANSQKARISSICQRIAQLLVELSASVHDHAGYIVGLGRTLESVSHPESIFRNEQEVFQYWKDVHNVRIEETPAWWANVKFSSDGRLYTYPGYCLFAVQGIVAEKSKSEHYSEHILASSCPPNPSSTTNS